MIKVGYYVEVSGSGGKKAIWEMVEDHVVNDSKGNAQKGL